MKKRTEAVTPPDLALRVLAVAGESVVLVGGQALAFWVQRFDIAVPKDLPAISADMDFLARSAADTATVTSFARAIAGTTLYPSRHALTALVGQAFLEISNDEFVNVDVLFKVVGITAAAVRVRAVRADIGAHAFRVMHPLHVLRSRLMNLHKLSDKQNQKGILQLGLAIDVAREFLREQAASFASVGIATGRSPIQRFVSEIEGLAAGDAGRKVAARYSVHVADAIDPRLIPAGPFWTRRWPALRSPMSASYASAV